MAVLTKITQWVRSRDGSGILRSIWSGTPTSQSIWEVKYLKSCYLWPKSVDHFCIQPEGLREKGRLPRITAQSKSPALVARFLHPWWGRATPEGTAGDCPSAGVISLTGPWSFSEPIPACNPPTAGNKSCLKCMLNHSSLLLLLLLLALLLASSGLGSQSRLPAFWAWGEIRKAKKLQRCTQCSPTKPSRLKHDVLDLQAYRGRRFPVSITAWPRRPTLPPILSGLRLTALTSLNSCGRVGL